ncbi:MAG: DotU family type IV/VI secretion system protein [Myxococcales bacterium]|jgi:type VI secretion system protein ImpK
MMDPITEITETTFNALAQLKRLDPSVTPNPEMLHQQLSMYIEQAGRAAGRLGFSQQDADDIRYALVALADETVLSRGGELRDFWLGKMLQLRFFNENVAGEAFFHRLSQLRGDRGRAQTLRVYYICLLFGFKGRYGVRGGELELADITDGVRDELVAAGEIPDDEPLSPRGARPHEPAADSRRGALITWIAVMAAVSSVLLYVGERLSLVRTADRLVERLLSLTGG